jgi:DNA-binding transcriptional LysR family regulator
MNIEDVRAFVAVVDTGSVGRAALRLSLTQPAISRRVQRLEEALGVTLLDRESKPARPTREGEATYGRCMALLRAAEALTRESRAAAPAGPLRIGVSYAIADSIFAPALEAMRSAYPRTLLQLISARSPDLRRQVANGHLDAGVVMAPADRPADDSELLGIEQVVVVAGCDLPVPDHGCIADLAGHPWVINPDGCGFRAQLDRALATTGHALEVAAESWGTALQLALVARGAGLGLVPERLIAESSHAGALRRLHVEDFRPTLGVLLIRGNVPADLGAALDVIAATVRRLLGGDALTRSPERSSP